MEPEFSVVFDDGSSRCKAALSIDTAPRFIIPSLCGRSRDFRRSDWYSGEDALERQFRGSLFPVAPISFGHVCNWDHMEKLWGHIFYDKLRVAPEEQPLLITESPINHPFNREKLTQVMFEEFNVPGMYLSMRAPLALLAAGKTTGVVLECGHDVSHTVPVYETFALPHAIQRMDLAGRDLIDLWQIMLSKSGVLSVQSRAERRLVTNALHKHGYMALNCEEEKVAEVGFEMPDGKVINLGDTRFRCPEALFASESALSALAKRRIVGVHLMVRDSIEKCSRDIRGQLWSNVALDGGSTVFPGFRERLSLELKQLCPKSFKPNVIEFARSEFATCIGGSIFASLSTFHSMLMLKSEYEDQGASIVHRKCF